MKIEPIAFTDAENIVLNMSAGLLPENLTKSEVKILIDTYGENWFEKLGYSEPKYKKPKFNNER